MACGQAETNCKGADGLAFYRCNGAPLTGNQILTMAANEARVNSRLPPCQGDEHRFFDKCLGYLSQSNGAKYIGEFADGYFHGMGAYLSPDGKIYVGEFKSGQLSGVGVEYAQDGSVKRSGTWKHDQLISQHTVGYTEINSSYRYEIEELQRKLKLEREERERNRPPEQRVVFCVESAEVRGVRYPSIYMPYCQKACLETHGDSLCSVVRGGGDGKWKIQSSSPKSAPPAPGQRDVTGPCTCIGQSFVLNEIKDTPASSAQPAVSDLLSKERVLAERERALGERERVLLEAENKRLKEELEKLKQK